MAGPTSAEVVSRRSAGSPVPRPSQWRAPPRGRCPGDLARSPDRCAPPRSTDGVLRRPTEPASDLEATRRSGSDRRGVGWSGDPDVAQAAIGVNSRVDQREDLADLISGPGAGKYRNPPAVDVADSVPLTITISTDAQQHTVDRVPSFVFEADPLAARPVRRFWPLLGKSFVGLDLGGPVGAASSQRLPAPCRVM